MRIYVLMLLVCLSSAQAIELAVSPSVINLDHDNSLWLINTNDEPLKYYITSDSEVSKNEGWIDANSKKRIRVFETKNSSLYITFNDLQSSLKVNVTTSVVPLNWPVLGFCVLVSIGFIIALWRIQSFRFL